MHQLELPENLARLHDYVGPWAILPAAGENLRQLAAGTDWPKHMAAYQPSRAPAAVEKIGSAKEIAVIKLAGVLTKAEISVGFGTSTVMIRRQIRAAVADPDVAGILIMVDSPGGSVSGLADLAAEVQAAAKKPTWAFIEDMAASGGYWAICSAARIVANAPTALVGSIGTIMTVYDISAAYEKAGVKTLVFATGDLKGTGAEGARVSEEQAAYLQRLVDDTQTSFDAAVRSGRNLSGQQLAAVKTGEVFLAPDAMAKGLIDGIQSLEQTLIEFTKLLSGSTLSAGPARKRGMRMSEEIVIDAAAAETQRLDHIQAAAASALQRHARDPEKCQRIQALASNACDTGMSQQQFDLALLRQERSLGAVSWTRGRNVGGVDQLAAALVLRSCGQGLAQKAFTADVLNQTDELKQTSLVDLCRQSLLLDGRDVPRDRHAMIAAALSTGSMPVAFGDAANKILSQTYAMAPASWRAFAAVRPAADFKTHYSVRPAFLGTLEQVGAGGEIKHGSFSEAVVSWSINTFAKMFAFDRRDVVNDNLSVLSEVAPALAKTAARSLNDLVYTTLLANTGSHFSSGNSNYFEGAATNLQASSLATALQYLRQMTDANGSPLDLQPAVLLVPPELEVTGRQLLESSDLARDVSSTDNLPTGNALRNLATLSVEPRLSNSGYTGYSTTAWYLLCGQGDVPFLVGFLDGQESPKIETFGFDAQVDRLALSFRCYHDFGAALGDGKAAIKSKGAA